MTASSLCLGCLQHLACHQTLVPRLGVLESSLHEKPLLVNAPFERMGISLLVLCVCLCVLLWLLGLLTTAFLVGGEGFQLFVDEGVAVDSDLIARLVKEVILQIAIAMLREMRTERNKEASSCEDCIHYSDTFEDLTSSSGLQTPIVPTPDITPPSSLPLEENASPTEDSALVERTVVATPSPSPPPSPVHSTKEEEPVGPNIDTPEVIRNHYSFWTAFIV